VERILVLPLYPQYSATTTAAVYDQYARLLSSQRNISDVIIHKRYCDRDDYIQALVASVKHYWKARVPAQKLLFSFHGIPKRCVELGDPYFDQCQLTARRVASELKLDDDAWSVSFQSRLGKAEWLTPYTDQLLGQWAKSNIASVDVICPAFAADCLETIEEIDGENRALFLGAGGKEYGVVPCLNSNAEHIAMLSNIVEEYVGQIHRASDNQYFS
jgi:ferrochelatase